MRDSGVDEAIDALGHEYRRRLLVELREHNPHGEVPTGSLGSVPPDRIAVEMIHVHLPKLEDYGYVEWDRETETVVRGPRYDEIAPLLDVVVTDDATFADD